MRDFENSRESTGHALPKLPLLDCFVTSVHFKGATFELIYCKSAIKIALDEENYAVLTLKNQQVYEEGDMHGSYAISSKKAGTIKYKDYFDIHWLDEISIPEMAFFQQPLKIVREYDKGQKIELGIEEVSQYRMTYQDGVAADFNRSGPGEYTFSFSTGFNGSFMKEEDGGHVIRFKGLPYDADEGNYTSESKFIISRSKYTNNLVLILQDKATVAMHI